MISLVIAAVVGVLITALPTMVRHVIAMLQDSRVKHRAADMNRYEYEEAVKQADHRKKLDEVLKEARKDKRLWGLQRVVKTPLVDGNGFNVDKKGNRLEEGEKPIMVPEKDEDGKKVKEYIFDKWCTDYTNPNPKVGALPISIDPGKFVPSWPTVYKYGYFLSFVMAFVMAYFKAWPLLVIPLALSITVFETMMKQGKACQQAFNGTWDKLDVIYNKYFGKPPEGSTVKDMITIDGWEAAGESQAAADATTYAAEIGKSEEADKVIHPKNKNGKEVKPRIARFRDIPSKMTIRFGTNFMQSSCKPFIDHMKQNFGNGTIEWLAMKTKVSHGRVIQEDSWDFDKQVVTLMTNPPLPNIAAIPEDLDMTPWNLIRLGRTVDGEATWDLSGQGWGPQLEKDEDGNLVPVKGPDGKPIADQIHHSDQAGVTCPMGLVPLDVDTPVYALVMTDDEGHEVGNSSEPVVLPAGSDGSLGAGSDIILS